MQLPSFHHLLAELHLDDCDYRDYCHHYYWAASDCGPLSGFFFGRRNATLILSQRRQSPSASAASTAQPPPDRNGMSKTSNQTSTDDQIGAGCRPISAGPANGTCFYSGPSGRLISCSCCQSLGRVEQPLNRSLMHIWTDNRRRQVRAPLLVPMMAL